MKWKFENVLTDEVIQLDTWNFKPDIGCLRGVEFDMEIKWLDGETPKCIHPLTNPEQIDDLEVPHPENGLNTKYIEWVERMQKAADNLEVRINGKRVEIAVSWSHPGGPIPAAFALAGENMLMWMLIESDRMHRLMDIVTESHINCTRFFDELYGNNHNQGIGMGCDTAEMLSPELYREFVLPYYSKVYETFPGIRGLHMCGNIDHLLEILRDDMKITSLNGFGFPANRDLLGEKLGGNMVLSGGPSPMLIKKGPVEAIKKECRSYIETVGHKSGYILQPGGGTPVGTPVSHLHAMVEASKETAKALI
jgi:uroporphyrinogen-III decarboxylase